MTNNQLRAALTRIRRRLKNENILEVYCPKQEGGSWTHFAIQIAETLQAKDYKDVAKHFAAKKRFR